MKGQESYFSSQKKYRLYYQYWEKTNPQGILVFVHGLNEHSGRYQNPIHYFEKKPYSLYLFDLRGHGRSDGVRSHVEKFEDYIEDLKSFLMLINKNAKHQKIFLIGHSMGGQIVLDFVSQYPKMVSGFIASSPNILTKVKINWLKKNLGMSLAYFLPKLSLGNDINAKWISRNTKVVEDYQKDPMTSPKITLKLASEIFKNQEKLLEKIKAITTPALIQHGSGDEICDHLGSELVFKTIKSPDKHLQIYPGHYHELFNDLDYHLVLSNMDAWIKKRI
ncbi:MAG: hypothetical protein A3G32_08325 [Deltaproteobacteria bacterium RIFCSPLOWO2_12_FULL_40_28]|nr:MAG: hypothetical protein A3C45_01025 [Deltaproteobacteria bacterium RIFCSPHIGHO2_02_FULL_40_28]OGQ20915.1 MAG: hypothetical protein A3E27_03690 [Deltaproteobacteria bacterium RIFCSPHIGHO2_12_FULL_40_32]OGQ39316.1 MAG: hypothetical protein A3I69_05050 [Deltaproteobacteria bacterium RIFCSPLOWO2_02_FULL_40_36]OGQ54597.1 MAG: hypothetical protein A3G32_08325 [Deltaproteobacteria bacterium RIFCSPLOWO2_12_FULL_40_28]